MAAVEIAHHEPRGPLEVTASPPWYPVLGLPPAGACVVPAARQVLPGDGGGAPDLEPVSRAPVTLG